MKQVLLLGATGTVLFVATTLGLLAAQGRLNHEGTKNLPVLSAKCAATSARFPTSEYPSR